MGWHRTGLGPLQAHQRDPRTPSSDGRGRACTLSRWDRAPHHLLFLRLPAPSTGAGPADPMGRLLAQSRCSENVPRPPFPPRTELGQAPADCSPQQPPSRPRLAAPEQDPGEGPVSLPTPTPHGYLQPSPASATRASVAVAPGSSCVPRRGRRPPAPLPCSSADWLLPRGLPVSRARLRWNYSPRPAPAAGSGASWLGRALSSLFLPGPSEVPVG